MYGAVRSFAGGGGAQYFWRTVAIVACALGMMAKEVMVTAPVMVLLFDWTFVSGSWRGAWRSLAEKWIGKAR